MNSQYLPNWHENLAEITQRALEYFYEISRIYRPSRWEEGIRDWLVNWAKNRWYQYEIDSAGNLLIRAFSGKDSSAPLCLQSHMDMVCVGWLGKDWTYGVEIAENDGVISAMNSSLGADNGLGVVLMLAMVDTANRPPLELLFTIGEEVWLIGVSELNLPLSSQHGINLDWCDSTTIGVGCGGTLLLQGNYVVPTIKKSGQLVTIWLSGLIWGHSGMDIGKNRGNAIIYLCYLLQQIFSHQDGIDLIAFQWWDADNAIPHSARAMLLCSWDRGDFEKFVSLFKSQLSEQYPWIQISLEYSDDRIVANVVESSQITNLLSSIISLGSGVQHQEWDTVLSSWNLGVAYYESGTWALDYFLRSNKKNGIEIMREKIFSSLSVLQWQESCSTRAWVSTLSDFTSKIQTHFWDIPPIITHATMEAGVLSDKYPDIEWVSVGPTVANMHTVDESFLVSDFDSFAQSMFSLVTSFVDE